MEEGKYRGKERFVVETEDERKTLEDARNFFGDARTLYNKGLEKIDSKKGANSRFIFMRRGKYQTGYPATMPVEDWEKIEDFASRYRKGEIGDPSIITLKI